MSYLVAALGLRLVLAGIIYLGTVSYWVTSTRGWESLGIFAASIVFGFFAAGSLLISMIVARRVANRWIRLLVHPTIALALFAALSYVIVGTVMGMPNDVGRDMISFTGLLAVIAVIDTLAGHMLDGWGANRQMRSAV